MIGIIGFGRFGKLTARYLAEDFGVLFLIEAINQLRSKNAAPATHR
jgi:lactate dehydrogenase-like 2-hydroxyacid dehydrogenase